VKQSDNKMCADCRRNGTLSVMMPNVLRVFGLNPDADDPTALVQMQDGLLGTCKTCRMTSQLVLKAHARSVTREQRRLRVHPVLGNPPFDGNSYQQR
jgi:hypothetical protein